MSSSHQSIGVHELQIAYATEQMGPRQVVDLVLERIAAFDPADPWSRPVSGNECYNTDRHSRARLAVPIATELDFEGDDAMRDAFDAAVARAAGPVGEITLTTIAPLLEPVRRNTVLGRYTQFVNVLDLAAVTVPAGQTPDGRPASITLIGPAFCEPLLLSVANRLSARTHLAGP